MRLRGSACSDIVGWLAFADGSEMLLRVTFDDVPSVVSQDTDVVCEFSTYGSVCSPEPHCQVEGLTYSIL